MFHQTQTCALFISGQSLHSAASALGFRVDYAKLRAHFADRTMLLRAKYYAVERVDEQDHSPLHGTLLWLSDNGYSVESRRVSAAHSDDGANMQCQQQFLRTKRTVDAMSMRRAISHFVFFESNPELIPLVEALQSQGATVTVVGTERTAPPHLAPTLRRTADQFVELADLQNEIALKTTPQHAA